MIYCRKKQEGNHYAVYAYGHDTANMTGEVCFRIEKGEIQTEVTKYPDQDQLGEYGISKVVCKYMDTLLLGAFPEKMAYERG